jgi:hypothetical protein
MVLAEVADRRRREHALTDLLTIDLPHFEEPIDQRRHHAGGPPGGRGDHQVAAPVFLGRR